VCILVNGSNSFERTLDLGGGLGPAEGAEVFIPVVNVAQDGGFELLERIETAPANSLTGDQGEPALNQIEPRGTGRGKVDMKIAMDLEPLSNLGMLVCAVIVADQVQFAQPVTLGQELQEIGEFNVGVARIATAVDFAADDLTTGSLTVNAGRKASDIGQCSFGRGSSRLAKADQ
jgi:hypothetical protein